MGIDAAFASLMEQYNFYRLGCGYSVAKTPMGWAAYLEGIELEFRQNPMNSPKYYTTVQEAVEAVWKIMGIYGDKEGANEPSM